MTTGTEFSGTTQVASISERDERYLGVLFFIDGLQKDPLLPR
jgi:hypothetical protein